MNLMKITLRRSWKMKINKDIVIKRFEKLDAILKELKTARKIGKREFLSNFSKQMIVHRALVLSVNICIDIGTHIIAYNNKKTPETYSKIFQILKELNIIPERMEKKLIEMVGLRNLLGHLYMEIDNEIIYDIIQKEISIFSEFKKRIISNFADQLLHSD